MEKTHPIGIYLFRDDHSRDSYRIRYYLSPGGWDIQDGAPQSAPVHYRSPSFNRCDPRIYIIQREKGKAPGYPAHVHQLLYDGIDNHPGLRGNRCISGTPQDQVTEI